MRLPRSIIRSLSVRTVHLLTNGIALLLFGLVSMSASASVPQLASLPSSLRFGAVDVGQSQTQLITVTNTGQTNVTISAITVNNPQFATSPLSLPLVLSAGQSVDVNVSFTPSAIVWTGGAIKIISNGSPLAIELAGTGVSSQAVSASPASLSFGPVAMGSSATLPVVVTNNGSLKTTIEGVQSADTQFSMKTPAVPFTLGPGQSVTLNVTFTPQWAGACGGGLFVYGARLNIPLTGTGTTTAAGQLSVAPAPLNFGDVAVGTTATQPITLTASGATVTVSSASSSSSLFVLEGMSFPLTIPAGQQLSFNVAFTPQNSGTDVGSLSFTSNASNSQATESLSGIGTITTYNVSLYWNSSAGVSGYNVYRSASANGSYAKINSSLDGTTAYTDSTVVAGQTYYYEATAVNSSGQESARSTPPVQAIVP
jgi:hypothetical protein